MDIKRFDPMTQQTLRRLDFNLDQQLSAAEMARLGAVLKNTPDSTQLGIAPKDRAVIQSALQNAKQPNQIIVSLVDDNLSQLGIKAPQPLYEAPADPSTKTTKGPVKLAEGAGIRVTATPKIKEKPPTADDEEDEATGLNVKTAGEWGGLKLEASTDIDEDTQRFSSTVSGRYSAGPIEVGARSDATKILRGESEDSPRVDLHGQAQVGSIKLRTEGSFETGNKGVKDLKSSAEWGVVPGHQLSVSAQPKIEGRKVGWSSVEVGSSHEFEQLTFNTKTALEPGKKPVLGGGVGYKFNNGLSINAEANTDRTAKVGFNWGFKF